MSVSTAKSQRLQEALERFANLRERLRARQAVDAVFHERCAELLIAMREMVKRPDIREVVELLGDLAAFRHTDGNGMEIMLLLSAQRDRVIINERYFKKPPHELRREGSDILLSISAIEETDISPDRCLVYQLLQPVELFAVKRHTESKELRTFIEHRFGLVCSEAHMAEFVQKLYDSAPNPDYPLPEREEIPAYIEQHLEEHLAESIELRTGHMEDELTI